MRSPTISRELAAGRISEWNAAYYQPLAVCKGDKGYYIGSMVKKPGEWPKAGTVDSPYFETYEAAQRWFDWIKQQMPDPLDWLQGA